MKKQTENNSNRKLKIVYFGQKRIPSREGGVEVVVEELATRMAAHGHEVTCINRRGHHVSGEKYDGEELTQYRGIRLQSVPTIERKGFAAASSSFFATLKASFGNYDVVHIHAEGPAAFCWMPRLFGKKVVVTCHGLDWMRPRWKGSWGEKYIRFGEKMMVRHADHIIVLSEGVQDYFLETYHRITEYIPNGVNRPQPAEPELIKAKWGLEKDTYYLALSRLTEEKKIHLLIEAFKQIDTNKKLVIAGGSSDSEEYVTQLHELAKKDDRIQFTGFVQGKEMEELYSNAYVYVLPSELEGMPLSLLEAMSYGNCCLVSDIAECISVIGDKGIVFKKNDLESLKQELQYLLEHPDEVDRLKKDATGHVCNRFNWEDVSKATELLYYG